MATTAAPTGSRNQTNGVLPVTASQTSGSTSRPTAAKPISPKLKVIIRRLPPGLTEEEFTLILGDEWRMGQGKVDWFLYKPGKDSKDPSKPSRPSRAYLHLANESHLLSLSDAVKQAVFEDAQNTFTNPCLVGPPTVEFAPYGRTPGGKRRVDARAGTIDQDPEFMAFLEGLANPTTTREINADAVLDISNSKQEKVTTTPLVQYLKDKKANKSKELAAKAAKKQEAQNAKSKANKELFTSPDDVKKRGKDSKSERPVDKAAKEAVKILNRQAASKGNTGTSTTQSESSGTESSTVPKLDVSKVAPRQRGAVVAAHKRMLQRDLGLSPAQAHRQVRRDTADAQKAEKAAISENTATEAKESTSSQSSHSQTTSTSAKANSNPLGGRKSRGKGGSAEVESGKGSSGSNAPGSGPSAPIVLLKKPENQSLGPASTSTQPTKPSSTATTRKPQQIAVPSEGATQAFIKHANPSQGVTEALLKAAMEKFGAVSMVEIDKRKGFAYVDFIDTEGLKKAMAANPISVAQGTVQVMQRKGTALPPEKKPVQQTSHNSSRGGRGGRGGTIGRRGGRGGARGNASSVQSGSSDATKSPLSPASTTTTAK